MPYILYTIRILNFFLSYIYFTSQNRKHTVVHNYRKSDYGVYGKLALISKQTMDLSA